MDNKSKHLLVGCSFTDPLWQKEIPWSVQYSATQPCYIVAKVGMGIKGICTEALYYLRNLKDVSKLIVILPTLWRLDVEMDVETYLCNSLVDLLFSDGTPCVQQHAKRKWISSGGLNYDSSAEQARIFDLLYKHQGFLVIAKEHFRALQNLLIYCKIHNIDYEISAIQDPMSQLTGLDYIKSEIEELLDQVEYSNWFKFNGTFIDKFLNHQHHPNTIEHKKLCDYILTKENYHGKTI